MSDWYPSTSAFLKAVKQDEEALSRLEENHEKIQQMVSRTATAQRTIDDIYHRLRALTYEVTDPNILTELQDICNELYGQLR